MKILTNHLGYSLNGKKTFVVQCNAEEKPSRFRIVDSCFNTVYTGSLKEYGSVLNWNTGYYFTGEFSSLAKEGSYYIRIGNLQSQKFEIREHLITMRMLNAVSYYFKAQRSSGEWLLADSELPFKGDREGYVDAHGGWYDATGDYGIHFSHLSHSSYCNPQQVPFSAYTFFKINQFMTESGNEEYSMLKRRVLDEGHWGADFIMRMLAPSGSFFRSINRSGAFECVKDSRAIGFEYHHSSSQFSAVAATADQEVVTDANYETSLRSGGGLAIAALAIAARYYYPSAEYEQSEYLSVAKDAWKYLSKNNEKYTNDGKWNLVDEYCALIALTELYISTDEYEYISSARDMANRIVARIVPTGEGAGRLEVDNGIPFYSAADEGMPVVALIQYAEIEPDKRLAAISIDAAERIMRWKLELGNQVVNPFGYPVLESLEDNKIIKRFFFPHTSNAAPWWQGDNARVASISAAAREVASVTSDRVLKEECLSLAQRCVDWIMGCNPFDCCMIEGYGRNNIQYFFNNRHDFLNCPGGIVNGITSAIDDEDSIQFVTEPTDKINDNWRWAEQWIPHASWYLYAMALKRE